MVNKAVTILLNLPLLRQRNSRTFPASRRTQKIRRGFSLHVTSGAEGNRNMQTITRTDGKVFSHDPTLRGYQLLYRQDQVNHCPSCGRTHWYVGRVSAECAFCATALPLVEAVTGAGTHRSAHRPAFFADAA
jgi:hypothetical protein